MRWGVAWAAGAVLRGAPGRLEGGLVSRAGAGKDLRIKAACHSALEGGLEEGLWVEQGDDITIDVAYLSALKGRIVEGLLVAQEASTHLRMDVAYPVLPQRTVRGGPVGGAAAAAAPCAPPGPAGANMRHGPANHTGVTELPCAPPGGSIPGKAFFLNPGNKISPKRHKATHSKASAHGPSCSSATLKVRDKKYLLCNACPSQTHPAAAKPLQPHAFIRSALSVHCHPYTSQDSSL
eukprot:1159720-Pelagomonas_calceolata.AAC.12